MADPRSPLHEAARGGKVKVLQALLDQGTDVNLCNDAGATALHFAAGKAQLAAVELLLERGARVDLATANGYTVLHNAASASGAKAAQVVERLIAAGADLDAVGRHGNTPWFLSRNAAIAQAFANAGANLKAKNANKQTAAQFASSLGERARAQFLEATKPKAKTKTKKAKASKKR